MTTASETAVFDNAKFLYPKAVPILDPLNIARTRFLNDASVSWSAPPVNG